MDLFGVALVVFASARVIRLLVVDDAGRLFRTAIVAGFGVFGDRGAAVGEDMLQCPFCVGFWISLAAAASFLFWGDETWWQLGALALSVSYLAGHLAARLDLSDGYDY